MFDLAGIDAHPGQAGIEFELYPDAALAEFGGHRVQRLFEQLGERVDLDLLVAVSGELEKPLNDSVRLARGILQVRQDRLLSGGIGTGGTAEAFA